jgi:hypothetical protein
LRRQPPPQAPGNQRRSLTDSSVGAALAVVASVSTTAVTAIRIRRGKAPPSEGVPGT